MAAPPARVPAVAGHWTVTEPRISIIVPVLNEAAGIGAMLASLQPLRNKGHEIIVVDGGSEDATAQIAVPYADHVLHSLPGRAIQMNRGARQARGEILWFVHADTRIPTAADEFILGALWHNPACCWGRFNVTIEGRHWLLQVVAALMNLRSRLTGIATGDQGIFVDRAMFEAIGGYPEQPLMEDIELSRRLKTRSDPVCLYTRLVTSGRRWEQQGVVRTILTMWWLRLGYFFGARPEKLAARYNRGTS